MSVSRREDAGRVPLDPTALFNGLADAEIGYVLVGGFAVNAHGVIRSSNDLDICPDPDSDNLRRLAAFLEAVDAINIDAADFDETEVPSHDLEDLRRGGNFRLRTTLGALDVMQSLAPFDHRTWAVLDRNAEERRLEGIIVRVCGYDNLVRMKEAAGRDQDRIDLRDLRAARREL